MNRRRSLPGGPWRPFHLLGLALMVGLLLETARADTRGEREGSSSPAHAALAQGQEALKRRGFEDLRDALGHFQRAIGQDPNLAPAHAGMAQAYALLYDYPRAAEAARQTLALDDGLAPAHATLAFVRMHADWDWKGAGEGFRRALELDPGDPQVHHWHAIYLEVLGHSEEAVAAARKAVELDPGAAVYRAGLGYRLFWARRYEEALGELQATLELHPRTTSPYYFIGRAHVEQGRFQEARAAFEKAAALSPNNPNLMAAVGYLDARSGRRREALTALSKLERLVQQGYSFSIQTAAILTALGRKDEAFTWLDRAYRVREGALIWLKVDPRFDSLRADRRFQKLLEKMGLSTSSPRRRRPG